MPMIALMTAKTVWLTVQQPCVVAFSKPQPVHEPKPLFACHSEPVGYERLSDFGVR